MSGKHIEDTHTHTLEDEHEKQKSGTWIPDYLKQVAKKSKAGFDRIHHQLVRRVFGSSSNDSEKTNSTKEKCRSAPPSPRQPPGRRVAFVLDKPEHKTGEALFTSFIKEEPVVYDDISKESATDSSNHAHTGEFKASYRRSLSDPSLLEANPIPKPRRQRPKDPLRRKTIQTIQSQDENTVPSQFTHNKKPCPPEKIPKERPQDTQDDQYIQYMPTHSQKGGKVNAKEIQPLAAAVDNEYVMYNPNTPASSSTRYHAVQSSTPESHYDKPSEVSSQPVKESTKPRQTGRRVKPPPTPQQLALYDIPKKPKQVSALANVDTDKGTKDKNLSKRGKVSSTSDTERRNEPERNTPSAASNASVSSQGLGNSQSNKGHNVPRKGTQNASPDVIYDEVPSEPRAVVKPKASIQHGANAKSDHVAPIYDTPPNNAKCENTRSRSKSGVGSAHSGASKPNTCKTIFVTQLSGNSDRPPIACKRNTLSNPQYGAMEFNNDTITSVPKVIKSERSKLPTQQSLPDYANMQTVSSSNPENPGKSARPHTTCHPLPSHKEQDDTYVNVGGDSTDHDSCNNVPDRKEPPSRRNVSQPIDLYAMPRYLPPSVKSFYNFNTKEVVDILRFSKLEKMATVCEEKSLRGDSFRGNAPSDLRQEPFCLRENQLEVFFKIVNGWRPNSKP